MTRRTFGLVLATYSPMDRRRPTATVRATAGSMVLLRRRTPVAGKRENQIREIRVLELILGHLSGAISGVTPTTPTSANSDAEIKSQLRLPA